jgi:outer membrane biosynthesis protein TonB
LEAERQEAARSAAAQLEAQQKEAARREAARVEAARLEAQRLETAQQAAAQQEAQRREATRQEAARIEAARVAAEQEEAAKREAVRRAVGRQLDQETTRREAWSTARRVRLWGRTDPNAELIQYAEAWARKIQFNTPVDVVGELAKRPHTNPMVTVAIRSDGSVESVTFVLSSGVAEVDEAIRRIVQSHEHYQAFSPGLAREFDVIEIRRTWYFDSAVRLY